MGDGDGRDEGKYAEPELGAWLRSADPEQLLTVLVGASSRDQVVATGLKDAHRLHGRLAPQLPLGGVLIAERHADCGDEHLRMLRKQEAGSAKTLEFMTWLGIEVPRWMRNDIVYSDNPLQASYEQCLASARVVIEFCRRLGLPFGINIESVTNRKLEIEVSVELAKEIQGLLSPHHGGDHAVTVGPSDPGLGLLQGSVLVPVRDS